MAPHWKQASRPNATAAEQSHAASFEIDGETFLALPYSNPDLPLTAPRIVQMQVSLASLENAQLEFEPVSEEGSSAGSVLANVLVGADGQPLGIHILGLE